MEKNESTAAAAAPWMTEIAGGVVAGVVAVAYALSYAALLFPAALKDLLPVGLALALVSAALGALWLAWRSQLPFAIGGPDGNTTSILAATAATAAISSGATSASNVLALLVVATLCCAALFLVLGFGRLGAAVRYVPYPVIGGFLASTGWLIAVGAVRVLSGGTRLDGTDAVVQLLQRPSSLAAVALAVLYFVVLRARRHPLVLPALLVGSCAAVLAGLRLASTDEAAAQAAGWLFEPVQSARWTTPWQIAWDTVDAAWLAAQWLDILAVATVGTVTLLLGASGLEVMARRDISLDRELREHGWLNLAAAGLGGYLSLVSVGRSVVLLDSGVRTRLAGAVAGGVCLLALASAATLLQGVPKVVLAAFLLYLGAALLWEWVVEVRRRMGRADWVLIVVILATTAIIGFTVAVLAGILASCLNFALSYSRVGVVQHDLDGTALRSTVQRPRAHQQLLAAHGTALRVLVLRGVIFFGTASMLLDRVRDFLAPAAGQRVLVMDFSHVGSADSSAGLTFTKIAQLAAAGGARVVLCGLGEGTRAALQQAAAERALVCATLDEALDTAEDLLLRAHGLDPRTACEPVGPWMERELGGRAHWQALEPLLQRREVRAGQALMSQGQASDATLYLIESGRFDVLLQGGTPRRLASLMAGNLAGEMALYDDAERSATVLARQDSVVWALRRQALEQLQAVAPETAMRVHAFVARVLAERVRQANAAVAALHRGA